MNSVVAEERMFANLMIDSVRSRSGKTHIVGWRNGEFKAFCGWTGFMAEDVFPIPIDEQVQCRRCYKIAHG